MGGRVGSVGVCPVCGLRGVKDLFYDKRDSKLKCEKCYGEKE